MGKPPRQADVSASFVCDLFFSGTPAMYAFNEEWAKTLGWLNSSSTMKHCNTVRTALSKTYEKKKKKKM
jgi:hypothetical protein